nr:response regulator transcription factor [Clostridia bacterium]
MNILVIDQDDDFCAEIASMLCVHDVLGATSLKAAEEIINKEDLDVILIEYEMVERNSESWNDVLMLPARKKGIPVIFTAESKMKSHFMRAMKFNPDWYLLKPITSVKLTEEIQNAVNKTRELYSVKNQMAKAEEKKMDDIHQILAEMGF